MGSRCGSGEKWWNEKIKKIQRSRVHSPALATYKNKTMWTQTLWSIHIKNSYWIWRFATCPAKKPLQYSLQSRILSFFSRVISDTCRKFEILHNCRKVTITVDGYNFSCNLWILACQGCTLKQLVVHVHAGVSFHFQWQACVESFSIITLLWHFQWQACVESFSIITLLWHF
jgi:hypothetical protein